MSSFSQRKGIEPVSKVIRLDSMDKLLKNAIWNVLHLAVWSVPGFLEQGKGGYPPRMEKFSQHVWGDFFGQRVDKRPEYMTSRLQMIENWFFECSWNKVYDFLEFIVQPHVIPLIELPELLNGALERGGSGYRIVDRVVVDIVSESEIEMLQQTLESDSMTPVVAHLRRALELLADRDNPDYRNSIKESISAVESMAKIVADNPKASLGSALKALEKSGHMHPALKEAFQKLYGYTSDEDGIRHAMLEEPKLTAADAKYFLMSCTSFINYMKARLAT